VNFVEKYWENPEMLHVNTLPQTAYLIPYQTKQAANTMKRECSPYFTLLNGNWKYRYYENVSEIQEHFYGQEYDVTGWDSMPVPGMWQTNGYDHAEYITSPYPFLFDPPYVPGINPAGLYVHAFSFSPKENKEYQLTFEGVDSCFYLWVNGQFCGYSQGPHLHSTFDVTEYLHEGANRLAVAVLKWCDGSYLDDQDKIRMSGIFRDVYILERAKCHINDLYVKPLLSENFKSGLIQCGIEFTDPKEFFTVCLQAPDGVILDEQEAEAAQQCNITFSIPQPLLWSAEQPHLYTLTFTVGDELIQQRIGFRRIEIKNGIVYYNGSKIKFKGVNRHDSHPTLGYVTPPAHIRQDLLLMKQYNINTIRTSHYPNDPRFYEMCDELGFYIVEEADMESHGCAYVGDFDYIAKMPAYRQAILDRATHMVERDKNHSCIFMWSLGNESGWGDNLLAAAQYVKKRDPHRLVHMESHFTLHDLKERDYFSEAHDVIDVYGRMYPTFSFLHEFLEYKEEDRPLFLCEYTHAMGNSCGDLFDYWELIYREDRLCGGCIWEWSDHAIVMHAEDSTPYYGYGGDFGQLFHYGNICADGLTSPDRVPHSSLLEAKNVYAPVSILPVDLQAGKVNIDNRYEFCDLSHTVLRWSVEIDGEEVQKGNIEPHTAPRSSEKLYLPYNLTNMTGEGYVNVRLCLKEDASWAKAGHILYQWQGKLPVAAKKIALPHCGTGLTIQHNDPLLKIEGAGFAYTFHASLGAPVSILYNGTEYLDGPMKLNIWRAPLDNDRIIRKKWEDIGSANYPFVQTKIYDITHTQNTDGSISLRVPFALGGMGQMPLLKGNMLYTVYGNGAMTIAQKVTMRPEISVWLPRYGLQWRLKKDFSSVEYFGYGPQESYIDKHHSARMGHFSKDADENMAYLKPQESGSAFHTRWASLKDNQSKGLLFAGEGFSFNASVYTPESLTNAMHPHELCREDAVIVHTDYFMSGVGSASCGPELAKKYRLEPLDFGFAIGLMPLEAWEENLFDMAAALRQAGKTDLENGTW